MSHINKGRLSPKPAHLGEDLGACLAPLVIRRPSYALHCRRLRSCYYQLIIQSQSFHNPGVDSYDHAEAKAELLESTAFSRTSIGVMLTLYPESNSAAPPRMRSMCVCKSCLVHAGRVVCCKGVCDQKTECSLNNEDLRVWTK